MLYQKFLKIKHLLAGKTFQSKTLRSLDKQGEEGFWIAQAFRNVLHRKNSPDAYKHLKPLDKYREALLLDKCPISFDEIGSDQTLTVANIAQRAASPRQWSLFFYELSKVKKVKNILEIGTNLGVSGQYFIKGLEGKKDTKFTTIEGVKGLCEIAERQFGRLSTREGYEVIHGLYDQALKQIVRKDSTFDLIFLDGNHQYQATLNYFEWLKNKLTRRAVVIFDDIHWSPGMQKAWREASTQQGVVFSIDFFKLGVVVFDTKRKLPPESHYKLFLSV